jgi:hypothetical protein
MTTVNTCNHNVSLHLHALDEYVLITYFSLLVLMLNELTFKGIQSLKLIFFKY